MGTGGSFLASALRQTLFPTESLLCSLTIQPAQRGAYWTSSCWKLFTSSLHAGKKGPEGSGRGCLSDLICDGEHVYCFAQFLFSLLTGAARLTEVRES